MFLLSQFFSQELVLIIKILKQSTHPSEEEFTETAIRSYKIAAKKGAQTIERLEKVRARGRKRSMVG